MPDLEPMLDLELAMSPEAYMGLEYEDEWAALPQSPQAGVLIAESYGSRMSLDLEGCHKAQTSALIGIGLASAGHCYPNHDI
jgi:hypothetical protein